MGMLRFAVMAFVGFVGLLPAAVYGQPVSSAEAEVLKVVDAFHASLKKGDAAAAMRLLAPDVLLLEAGGIETRAQYEKDHLPGDIEFERNVTTSFNPYRLTVVGDVAWAISNSEYKGTFRERPVDSVGVELMVLARGADGWRVRAIHWSSRPRRPPA